MAKNNKQKQFAVLGLGRFGTSVALTLHELGYQVLGVDSDEEIVQDLSHDLTHVVSADASDDNTLRSLGINNYEVVIVGIGALEDNLLTTLNLKEMGVPFVAVKATSAVHGKMLEKIGADKIIYPERDMGKRVAHNLISSSIVDYIEMSNNISLMSTNSSIVDYIEMSNNISLMSTNIPPTLVGKNLIESELRNRYNVNVVAIKHDGVTYINPKPTQVLQEGDEMIVIGEHENVKALEEIV